MRRTELASLRLSDYDCEDKAVRIRGKRNKERHIYAEGGANILLATWLELRGEGEPEDPLILPLGKDGRVRHLDLRREEHLTFGPRGLQGGQEAPQGGKD